MEVAAPIVSKYLCSCTDHEGNLRNWVDWMLVCKDWESVVTTGHSAASARLVSDSSMDLRVRLWSKVLGIPDHIDGTEFADLVMEGSYAAWAEISRDSRRTFASVLRKRPNLHLKLTRILHALSAQFRDVGYCQGMNFVAGTVLLALSGIEDGTIFHPSSQSIVTTVSAAKAAPRTPILLSPRSTAREVTPPIPDSFMAVIQEKNHTETELLAFKVCEKLFMRNHFVQVYELGWHTRMTIWTFDKLVESVFPDLHAVITDNLQVCADFYASSWFITLFTADLDLRSSIRVMDLFIAQGPKGLHRFGLACLNSQREKILESGTLGDSAEGLKILRAVAATAVTENGVEALILSSVTRFKFINNRLLSSLASAGKLHGGARVVFEKDDDNGHLTLVKRSWTIMPMRDSALADALSQSTVVDEKVKKSGILSRLKRKKKPFPLDAKPGHPVGLLDGRAPTSPSGSSRLASSASVSPSRRSRSDGGAFKSFRKRIGGWLPGSRGYAKTGGSDLS